MPKINVYLPDDLAAAVKDAQLPVSAICQAALERAVRGVTALREESPSSSGVWKPALAGGGSALERFTPRAREAVALGHRVAQRSGHGQVGTEHLLLGILDEGENLAVRVLNALEVSPDDVRAELHGDIRSGTRGEGTLTLGPHTTRVLDLAMTESLTLGHNYIGCEHLLLGLIAEPEGRAGVVLRQLGLELRVTRRAVATALSGYLHARAQEPVITRSRLDEILDRLEAIERSLSDS